MGSKEIVKIKAQIERLKTMDVGEVFKHIRWCKEHNKGSVLDVIKLLTGLTSNNASNIFERIKKDHQAVATKCSIWKFPGARQRNTPVADTKTLIQIAFLCPGKDAYELGALAANTFARTLAGDLSLVDELVRTNGSLGAEAQEKLLSGTSSTPEQANAVPQALKFITQGHPLLMQPAYYQTCHVLDGSGKQYLKIGESNKVHTRSEDADQIDKTHYHHVIPMPNEQIKMRTERIIKKMALKLGFIGYKNEYLDPVKIGQCMGAPDAETWDTAKASLAILTIFRLIWPKEIQILEVYYANKGISVEQELIPESEVIWASPVLPGHESAGRKKVYVLLEDKSYENEFKKYEGYENMVRTAQEINREFEKESKRPVKLELEVEKLKLEKEKEKTKQIELKEKEETKRQQTRKDLIMSLIAAGKPMDEIKEVISVLNDNQASPSSSFNAGFENLPSLQDIFDQARDDLLVRTSTGGVRSKVYIPAMENWIGEHYPTFSLPDKRTMIHAIDQSLAGKVLNENSRRFSMKGSEKVGWRHYKFVDFEMQTANEEDKVIHMAPDLKVYNAARDALLVRSVGGGVGTKLYQSEMEHWINDNYPDFQIPSDKLALLRMVDESLTGTILRKGNRTYKLNRVSKRGWRNYQFRDPKVQAENDSKKD